ncbi:MAG: PaaI family thioesterase [Proteobacteria bacterium]|nr:PaaI family thioesterase [Pseudomonadota bacterium]
MGHFHLLPSLEELNTQWLPKLEQNFGVQITAIDSESLSAEFSVGESMLQPYGIMHGGISCVIGESLGSIAGHLVLQNTNKLAVGQSLQALHIRSAQAGSVLEAKVEALHIGGRSQIWETQIREKATKRLISKISLTLAVLEKQDKLKTLK